MFRVPLLLARPVDGRDVASCVLPNVFHTDDVPHPNLGQQERLSALSAETVERLVKFVATDDLVRRIGATGLDRCPPCPRGVAIAPGCSTFSASDRTPDLCRCALETTHRIPCTPQATTGRPISPSRRNAHAKRVGPTIAVSDVARCQPLTADSKECAGMRPHA